MSFIGKWLLKNLRNEEKEVQADAMKCESVPARDPGGNYGRPLNIRVYNAHGGKIITFQSYNKDTDNSQESTYIIHPDEVFAESLGKLIAMEEIKHV